MVIFFKNRGKVDAKYSLQKIVRLTKVVISWNLIYALLKLMLTILKKKIELNFIYEIPIQCIKSLVQKGFLWQFWFLGALMIIYFLLPIISKLNEKWGTILFSFLAIACVLAEVISYVMGSPIQKNIIQTFRIWTWLFYFMLGGRIEKVKSFLSKYMSMEVHGVLFGIYTILVIVWQVLVGNSLIIEETSNLHAEYFCDSFWKMIWIVIGFSFFLRLNIKARAEKFIKKMSEIVMGIYIVHTIVISVLKKVIVGCTFLESSVLFGTTVMISVLIVMVIKKIPIAKSLIEV